MDTKDFYPGVILIKNEDFEKAKKQFFPFMLKMSKRWRSSFSNDDVLHLCDIALWKSMERHDLSRAAFITYLGKMIHWEFLNNSRSEKEDTKTISLSKFKYKSGEEFVPEELSYIEHPEIVAKEEVGYIMEFLSPRQKNVLDMLREGIPRKEIAKRMDISPERVRQIYECARAKFNTIAERPSVKR